MFSIDGARAELTHTGFEKNLHSGEGRTADHCLTVLADLKFGIWEVTPGVFDSEWDDWEAFTVFSGQGTLTDGDGTVHELVPGALIVIPPGSTGRWDITETLRKTFVYPKDSVGR